MNYPVCPFQRNDCRFQSLGSMKTLMYSPIIYDRYEQPVDGGGNIVTETIGCTTCDKKWVARYTELERAQGKRKKWEKSLDKD